MRLMMMIIIIMGHECKCGGLVGRGKERIPRGEEDGSALHIYI
jgi:hypothetical protein